MKQERLTFRLSPGEMQTLKEMRERMNVSCSCIVRAIITDFLTRNEDRLEQIMYGPDKTVTQEEEIL